MSLSELDKNFIQTRLIRITDAKDEICIRIKEKSDCNECPFNQFDRCNSFNLGVLNRKTMKLEELD